MRFLAALGRVQETRRDLDPLQRGEEVVPGRRFTRQDHIAGFWILANKNLLGVEAVGCRQAYRLATAIGEQFGDLAHGNLPYEIYHDICQSRNQSSTGFPATSCSTPGASDVTCFGKP